MILLPPDIRFALRANDIDRRVAQRDDKREPDPSPVLKLFNPLGAATWLATELGADDDTLFGLADLGFGCPELGYFSLSEIVSVRLPFGLGIERDLGFETVFPLSRWADAARSAGSISGRKPCCAALDRPARTPIFRSVPANRTAVDARAARFAANPKTDPARSQAKRDRHSQGAMP